jgi:hypothetical protein
MPMIPTPPNSRQRYESLLNEVLDEVHKIAIRAQKHGVFVDDSRAHELVRNLRDNFGPEVPR